MLPPQGIVLRIKCEVNLGSKSDAGGGGESARYDEGKRILAHPSKEITPNIAETMIIETTDQWGSCEARLHVKVKQQTAQWIDEFDKTGRDNVGDENLSLKPGKYDTFLIRGAPQHDVQELE